MVMARLRSTGGRWKARAISGRAVAITVWSNEPMNMAAATMTAISRGA